MSKLLFIEGSPRGSRSASSAVAEAFIEAYRKSHSDDDVERINLWSVSLPSFDGDMLDAKYAVLHGCAQTPDQQAAWQTVTDMVAAFTSADTYVIATPMWNFSIPYKVKHYFDLIIQPGLTFRFSPETGYQGLVTGKKALMICARGGAYGPGTGAEGYDLQTKTLGALLDFIGITDRQTLLVEPLLAAPDDVTRTLQRAIDEAVRQADAF